MDIRGINKSDAQELEGVAELLREAFPHSYNDTAEEETETCLAPDRIALVAVENEQVAGFIGAIPQYGETGWELHPLVVRAAFQGSGIGTRLIQALEREVAARGGLTIYLGTDDEFGKTSLSQTDLFEEPFAKIEAIRNLNRHPYEFYQKMGYRIVGVIPDANGIGKPDIYMAKSVRCQMP